MILLQELNDIIMLYEEYYFDKFGGGAEEFY